MSSSIDNITCPKCGGNAQRETDHKTGEIYEHCNNRNCDYDEVIRKGEEEHYEGEEIEEKPTKYKLVDNHDGNIEVELESNTREEAIEEALGALGWRFVAYKDE